MRYEWRKIVTQRQLCSVFCQFFYSLSQTAHVVFAVGCVVLLKQSDLYLFHSLSFLNNSPCSLVSLFLVSLLTCLLVF